MLLPEKLSSDVICCGHSRPWGEILADYFVKCNYISNMNHITFVTLPYILRSFFHLNKQFVSPHILYARDIYILLVHHIALSIEVKTMLYHYLR